MSEYNRFTKKDKYGHWYTDTKINDRFMWSKDGKAWERDLTHCAFDGEAIDRLAELEDKIENGTLVELPKPFIEQQKEEPYAWQVFHAKVDIFAAAGKDIFPKENKESAEARLKELQEGKK